MKQSRLNNVTRNFLFGVVVQGISLILNFIVRTIFVKCLAIDYLGVEGLFSNILTVLSLAELGFGTAMVYSMYKPLAQKDQLKLQALMNLYKNVYRAIGICVAILGLSIIPFMDYIIKEKPNIDHLTLIYIMVLFNTVSSYFFSYKRSVLNADQQMYIISLFKGIFLVVKAIGQCVILLVWHNFYLYLVIQIICTLTENILVSIKVDKIYPFLKGKNNSKLNKSEVSRIVQDVKALMIYRLGHVALNGTDSIIISAFLGVSSVGYLSNYRLIVNSVVGVISQIPSALQASVGNFVVEESIEDQYKIFKRIDFIYFLIYGFVSICLCILLSPFISLWLGKTFILDDWVITVLCLNTFIEGVINGFWVFRSSMGLFVQGKYRPIFNTVINIVVSILLVKPLGVFGVLLGTTISRVCVNLWYDPYIILKYGLHQKVRSYYITFIKRIILLAGMTILISFVFHLIFRGEVTYISFVVLMLITILVFCATTYIVYRNNDEFIYLKKIAIEYMHKLIPIKRKR